MSEFPYRIKTNTQESSGSIEAESKSEAKRKLTQMFGTLPKGIKGKKPEILEMQVGE